MLILLAIAYLAWLGVLYLAQDAMIFPRLQARVRLPAGAVPAWVERLHLTTPEGASVEAWFIPGMGERDTQARRATVLFAHGNAELIDDQLPLAENYRARGLNVLLIEYRGYGGSGGRPSQDGIVPDAVAFYDTLAARPDVDPARIIFHGRSIGTGVVAQLAAQRPPAALILESPFTSVASFAWQFGAPPWLIRHPFHTDRVLPTLHCPITILHSRHDEIVPFAHGERLHALVPSSTLIELEGGHNDVLMNQPAYWAGVEKTLSQIMP